MTKPHPIVYCYCAYGKFVPKEVKQGVLERLAASGAEFDAVADLCEMSAQCDPGLQDIARHADVQIAACYPRAVRWLFAAAKAPLSETGVKVRNLRTESVQEVADSLLGASAEGFAEGRRTTAALAGSLRVILYEGDGSRVLLDRRRFELIQTLLEHGYSVSSVRGRVQLAKLGHGQKVVLGLFNEGKPAIPADGDDEAALRFVDIDGLDNDRVVSRVKTACDEIGVSEPGGWKPWFPVIDYARCVNCMQCLSFCLFNVYGVAADGQIAVQRQTNCKTDCPACARVCPEAAIIFPKYMAGPINGDEIREEDVRREAMKIDVSSMLGGDLYSVLRDRSAKAKSRFSKERDDERALQERQRCMKTLQQSLNAFGIPADAIAGLSILDQIQAEAEEAKRRAQAALEQHRSAER